MSRRAPRVRRPVTLVAWLLAVVVLISGCRWEVSDLPLPGGPDVGSNPLSLSIEFTDVLDLVPDSAVKVADVTVGKVEKISLVDGHALVTVKVRRDTKLPANTVATLRQTSLLGEKFVDLAAPASGASAELLASGATITLASSGRNPEVEEVLGALSLILNGGGVAQLQTITTEVNRALSGREDSARAVLTQADTFAKRLDQNKGEIVRAIDALDRLAASAAEQQKTLDATVEELPSAVASLETQRAAFVTMLDSLAELGTVGSRVIGNTKADVIRTVTYLEPTLTQLAEAGDHLVNSIDTVFTYPFVDEIVGRDPQIARNIHLGDYVNLSLALEVDAEAPLKALATPLPSAIAPTKLVPNLLSCLTSGSLTSKACKELLAAGTTLANIQSECKKPGNRDTALCVTLNMIPGLPNLTGIVPSQLPSLLNQVVPSPLNDLLGGLLPGLLRAAPASSTAGSAAPLRGRFTYAELGQAYDPTLVRLLVPGVGGGLK